jgi:hypothetical protein
MYAVIPLLELLLRNLLTETEEELEQGRDSKRVPPK